MSSLQKQLAAIAASDTNELDLKAQKTAHSQSLLFEPATAANQSFDLLYQTCLEGFDQLCALDSRFTRFAQSLFSPQSRTEDRAQMNSAQNKNLQAVINSFMTLVGGRLLLTPAMKTVEWLVRRFRIHEYDTVLTVMTFLPYHTASIFKPLLSILPKQLPPAIKFLHAHVNSLSNPPRSVIVHTATNNLGFSTALNEYVLAASKSRHHHSMLLSFWASIMGQTVNGRLALSKSGRQPVQHQREDELLVQFLPVLSEALSMKKAPELILGAYMITIILVTRAQLSENVLDGLVEAVILSWTIDTLDAGLGCVAAIVDRKHELRLPARALKAAFKVENLGTHLVRTSRHQNVQALASALAASIIESRQDEVLEKNVIETIKQLRYHSIFDQEEESRLQNLVASRKAIDQDDSDQERLNAIASILGPGDEQDPDKMQISDTVETNGSQTNEKLLENGPNLPRVDFAGLPGEVLDATMLSVRAAQPFYQVMTVYHKACGQLSTRASFSSQTLWQNDQKPTHLLLLSFYARCWTSNSSHAVRKYALQDTTKNLDVMSSADIGSAVLLLVPYAVIALADLDQSVRRSAADLVLALCKSVDTKTNRSQSSRIWQMYGPTIPEAPKHTEMLLKLLSIIRHELESCIADPSYVQAAFRHCIAKNKDKPEGQKGALRSIQRAELFATLAYHIRATPSAIAKLRLLSMCNSIDKVNGQPRSVMMMDCLRHWVDESSSLVDLCHHDNVDASELDEQFSKIVQASNDSAVGLVLSVTDGSRLTAPRHGLQQAAFQRLQKLWPSFKSSIKLKVVFSLIDSTSLGMRGNEQEFTAIEAGNVLRSLTLSAEIIAALLKEATEKLQDCGQIPAKRRKNNDSKAVGGRSTTETKAVLSRLSFAVELVDAMETPFDGHVFHTLFDTLQTLQAFSARTNADIDYLELLVIGKLSAMSKTFEELSKKPQLDLSLAPTDSLLACARRTSNIQTRNAAILLLAALAKYVPDNVLRTMIPVFVLMSSDTVRQSDEFSAHVVDQTIQEVMPLLVEALRRQKSDLVPAILEIMSNFVTAYDHIAPTRRLKLFTLLADTIGPEEFLHAIIAILVDRFPRNAGVASFGAQLLRHYSVHAGLKILDKYLSLASSCGSPDPTLAQKILGPTSTAGPADSRVHALLAAVPVLIRDGVTPELLAIELHANDTAALLRQNYGALVERILQISRQVNNQPQSRHLSSRILETVLQMLPFSEFVKSVENLIDPESPDTSRGILKAFEVQLRLTKENKVGDSAGRTAAIALLPRMTNILTQAFDKPLALNAVVCIDQICGRYGKLDIIASLAAAQAVAHPRCWRSENALLRALSLHCLGTMVEVLQNDFIPVLQTAIQASVDSLHSTLFSETMDMRLHNAAFALAISVVDRLPYMLTLEMLRALLQVSHNSATSTLGEGADAIRNQFLQTVASRCELPMVFHAARSSWLSAIQSGPQALSDDLSLVQIAITSQTKTDIGRQSRLLLDSFLTFFDLRRIVVSERLSKSYTEAQTEAQERTTIDTFIALVLKINDATFRPFFVRLVEWTENLPKHEGGEKMLRQVTLFRLLAILSDRLKSLITPYFTHVLDPLVAILDTSTTTSSTASKFHQQTQHTLLLSAFSALTSSLTHDNTTFYANPARFQPLLAAVLNPLPNFNPTASNSPTQTHLIPAILALAHLLTSNPEQLTTLTTSILTYLKSSDRRSRIAGIMVMRALTREIGESWLAGQLPRMLPVVGELVEDGDERVESEAGAWVGEMEGVLGESLGDMLA